MKALAVPLAGALLLAAGTAPAIAATRNYDVTLKFTKASVAGVSTIAVTNLPGDIIVNEGDTVEITIKNDSPIPEGFSIDAYGVHDVLKPGQTRRVHIADAKAGSYVIYCQLHPLSVHGIGHLLVVSKS